LCLKFEIVNGKPAVASERMGVPLPDMMEIVRGEEVKNMMADNGSLTVIPVNIYNSSTLCTVISIAGLPLGLIAIVINTMLIYSKPLILCVNLFYFEAAAPSAVVVLQ
jgi:hypothetical protein